MRKGQSTIEVAITVILVITAVVAIGPYILRSINAHFKLWDDSVQESFEDQFVEAHPSPPTACDCTWEFADCGVSGCKENEGLFQKNCTPVGCDTGLSCIPDDRCCTQPQRTAVCWRSADDIPYPASSATIDHVNATRPSMCGSYHYPCQPWDRIWQFTCGTHAGQQVCVQGTNTQDGACGDRDCTPVCKTFQIPHNLKVALGCDTDPTGVSCLCPGANIGLVDDTDIHYVAACPPDPSASVGSCNVGCPNGFTFDPLLNECRDMRCGDTVCDLTGGEGGPTAARPCCVDCPTAPGCVRTVSWTYPRCCAPNRTCDAEMAGVPAEQNNYCMTFLGPTGSRVAGSTAIDNNSNCTQGTYRNPVPPGPCTVYNGGGDCHKMTSAISCTCNLGDPQCRDFVCPADFPVPCPQFQGRCFRCRG